eukprot:m.160303 g.160303  ORF g.160303 m.160303 type:complete len:86 (-) comp13383_c3_seq3:53-310(-)
MVTLLSNALFSSLLLFISERLIAFSRRSLLRLNALPGEKGLRGEHSARRRDEDGVVDKYIPSFNEGVTGAVVIVVDIYCVLKLLC